MFDGRMRAMEDEWPDIIDGEDEVLSEDVVLTEEETVEMLIDGMRQLDLQYKEFKKHMNRVYACLDNLKRVTDDVILSARAVE